MSPVRDDENKRPLYTPTKSAARLFNDLIGHMNTNSPSSYDRAKSLPLANEAALPPNAKSSPPPEAPNFAHTASQFKHPSSDLTQRILEDFQSQYNHQQQAYEPSPVDSCPRTHPRSHSRHRSSRSSETISAMFLIATERLAQETSRANEAERQSSEIIAHLKISHQAKQRLEIDLQRVKEELGLYKTQLDIAQAEIRRAQEVVDKVDQQRADAEEEARKGRERIRNLTEARSIELAMEEGRRLGYEEGMRQGRLMMQARDSDINQAKRYYQRTSFRSARDDDDDQASYFSYTQEERRSTESSRSPTNHSTSVRRTSGARPPIQPISTSRSTSHNQVPSSELDDNVNHPENIAVRPHPSNGSNSVMPIRPISIQNQSPTISHRSFKLPPDGYIPTIGVNSVISLPPPHELSIPIPPVDTSHPSGAAKSSNLNSNQGKKKVSMSQSSERTDRESRKRTPKSVDGNSSTSHSTLSRQPYTSNRNMQPTHPGSKSKSSSGVSTYINESSLLSPPDLDDSRRNENKVTEDFTEGVRTGSISRASTQSERMVSKRRCVNPDTMPPPSPFPAQSAFLDGYNASTSRVHGDFIIERPTSTQRSQSRPSRHPREIVLPTPLTATLLNSTVKKPDRADQETTEQWRNENDGLSSPGYRDTRPQLVHRSVSNITVPGIEIVTPSSHTSSTPSVRTVIDPVLLTPERAGSAPLPVQAEPNAEAPPIPSLGLYFNQPSSIPDNNFPPGFIPLSPIPGMKNLVSYPSGFSPRISKLQDEYPGGHLPSNFSYPSSPLLRSGV